MRIKAGTLTLVGLGILILVTLVGFFATRQGATEKRARKAAEQALATRPKLVDQTPLQTASSLRDIPNTDAEQKLSEQAFHLADREIDLSFASALQLAATQPPSQNPTIKALNDRIRLMESRLQTVQQQVARLSANPRKDDDGAIQQQLEIAQARVDLLKDAIDDAKQDLIRAGGDPQAEIQQELQQHEALEHTGSGTSQNSGSKPRSFEPAASMVAQFRSWRHLRANRERLLEAQQQARNYTAILSRKHEALEKGLKDALGDESDTADDESAPAAAQDQSQHAAQVSTLQTLSLKTKLMSLYDKRIDAEQQLESLYGDWASILTEQIQMVAHAILRSLLFILLAITALFIAERSIEHFYLRLSPDRRRLRTMRLLLRFVVQVLGVLVILLVSFGPPSQLSTILALGAAGLTVALKDFIVGFFGWFVLMGRHGIRAGDWVEINGIGGEVVEVGILRTILLETGNWNDAGHPTGRKVSFVNSYALEGHYFNFTTAGQWLWDELDVLIPAGEDPYYLTNAVMKLVAEQTRGDATQAEEEWRRTSQHSSIQTFSSAPAINVRPTNLGVNLVVRYVVNAQNRYAVRTKLYESIVELLHTSKSSPDDRKIGTRLS